MKAMFLTGATGFVASQAMMRYVDAAPDLHFYLMVRARDDEHLAKRIEKFLTGTFGDRAEELRPRMTFVKGDLLKEGLGMSEEDTAAIVANCDHVVHCAASVDFAMKIELSRQFNLDGTRRIIEVCEKMQRAGHFRRLDYVSTAYVSGNREDVVVPNKLSSHALGWANDYEQSKFEAESFVRGWRSQGNPVSIYRPSTVVGDSRTGETTNFNVLYWPLRVYARGWWNLMIGYEETPVDVVPVNYVADCLVMFSLDDTLIGRDYHLAAGPDKVCQIRDLAKAASSYFNQEYPRFVTPEKFWKVYQPAIAKNATPAQQTLIKQGVVYMPYFIRSPLFDTTTTVEDAEKHGIAPVLAVTDYFDLLFNYCIATDFGRKKIVKPVGGEGAESDGLDDAADQLAAPTV